MELGTPDGNKPVTVCARVTSSNICLKSRDYRTQEGGRSLQQKVIPRLLDMLCYSPRISDIFSSSLAISFMPFALRNLTNSLILPTTKIRFFSPNPKRSGWLHEEYFLRLLSIERGLAQPFSR